MSAPAFTVREAAAPDDAEELARLFEELGYPTPSDVMAARMRAYAGAGETVLVAADDARPGHLLGVLTIHVTPVLHRAGPVGRLTSLVVEEAARGLGVGRALVAAAEARFAARGCVLAEVTSNQRRTDAHAFYERLGYVRTSFRFGKPLR